MIALLLALALQAPICEGPKSAELVMPAADAPHDVTWDAPTSVRWVLTGVEIGWRDSDAWIDGYVVYRDGEAARQGLTPAASIAPTVKAVSVAAYRVGACDGTATLRAPGKPTVKGH